MRCVGAGKHSKRAEPEVPKGPGLRSTGNVAEDATLLLPLTGVVSSSESEVSVLLSGSA